METIKCKRCGIEKSATEYFKRDKTKYRSECKQCDYIRRADYKKRKPHIIKACAERSREKFREQRRIQGKAYRATLAGKIALWRIHAKVRKIEWKLTNEFFANKEMKCYYTGLDLTLEPNCVNTVSLDRIDSTKCYEEGNVVFCCKIINFMKLDSSVKDFVNMCSKIHENRDRLLTKIEE